MSYATAEALSRRHQKVRDACAARSLDALVVTSLPNILYLTNFTGSAATVVLTADRLHFITDFRYVTALAATRGTPHECPGLELVTVDASYDGTLASLLQSMPSARVGFESAHLTVARHGWLTATLGRGEMAPVLTGTEGIVERARVRKDPYELDTLRTAADMLTGVVPGIFEEVRRGRTERDVALAIDWRMRRAGFERNAFDTIVAAGPNGALPHAHPGERRLIEGDLVVLDFGGVYDSYCVDLTRTVSVGVADQRAREVYGAVRAAHDLAIESVSPGRSRFAIDAAARDELTRRGLGEAFGHGTGHGLGIEVHEDPRIGRRRPDADEQEEAVAPGMVFTIEPGAYLPGWGGVRIEDDVVVTGTGVDVLTKATTDLVEI
jgi:Xaa-Pro aminopeptidase